MFIPLKMVLIGIDPYPYRSLELLGAHSTTLVARNITTIEDFFSGENPCAIPPFSEPNNPSIILLHWLQPNFSWVIDGY
jgi:hypothetical protein